VRPSRHACSQACRTASAEKSAPYQPGPGAGGDLQAAAPRPQATSSMVSPGNSRSASATSAIAAQPSRLVDSRCGGRPRWRRWISSLTGDPLMAAYQPSKSSAEGHG
jgi:hypothetical protein